ncbi:hypothetical protein QBC34DRAFT_308595, partial [Podospora aff. communis PSN243]
LVSPWEIAPGRLVSPTGNTNIAYSSAYLSQSQTIPLPSSGTTFRLVNLAPGATASFPAEEERMRVCCVAQGTVDVRLGCNRDKGGGEEEKGDGEGKVKEFQIGPNGMWTVDVGWECNLVNVYHVAAAVHVVGVVDAGEEV